MLTSTITLGKLCEIEFDLQLRKEILKVIKNTGLVCDIEIVGSRNSRCSIQLPYKLRILEYSKTHDLILIQDYFRRVCKLLISSYLVTVVVKSYPLSFKFSTYERLNMQRSFSSSAINSTQYR